MSSSLLFSTCGSVSLRPGPHVYFIWNKDCLSIGETQRRPVIRWGQHLSEGGTLFGILSESEIGSPGAIEQVLAFSAFRLDILLDECHPALIKTTTQYIEHQLHVLAALRMEAAFGRAMRVVSNTTCTAPRRCKYQWASPLYGQIFLTAANLIKSTVS